MFDDAAMVLEEIAPLRVPTLERKKSLRQAQAFCSFLPKTARPS
jgi:hypothetical protein